MTTRTKTIALATAVLVSGGIVVSVWWTRTQNRRMVECWLDRMYLSHSSLAHKRHEYYGSYLEWSEAGKRIPNADRILVHKYRTTPDRDEQGRLLYAMGGIGSPTAISCLSQALVSARAPSLREHILTYGLLPNVGAPAAQKVLMTLCVNTEAPLAERSWVLAELLHAGNDEAVAYAKAQGQELLLQAQEAQVDSRFTTALAQEMRRLVPSSQAMPVDN